MDDQYVQRDDDMLDISDETPHASAQEDASTYNKNNLADLLDGIGQGMKGTYKPDIHIYRLHRTNHYA
jgi:hypothetical protein